MFTKSVTDDQLVALAGMFQACYLVDRLARYGTIEKGQLEIFMGALLNQRPDSTFSVYGNTNTAALENLRTGIETMQGLLGTKAKTAKPNILGYLVSVIYLAKKLINNDAMLNQVGDGLQRVNEQAEIFSITHENVVASTAQLYKDTIGSFRQRIQVNGYADHLQQQAVADRIRCLLFSAIRSAVLWHQLGGKRYQLFFQRRQIVERLRNLQPG